MTEDISNAKSDKFVELEFEVGDLMLEISGPADVVERIFKVLLDKLEIGKIEVTPREDEFEPEEDQDDIDEFELPDVEWEDNDESGLHREEPVSPFERTIDETSEPSAPSESTESDDDLPETPPSWDDLDSGRPLF